MVTAERGELGRGVEPGAVRSEGVHQPRLRWVHGRGERDERQREGRPVKLGAPRVSSGKGARAFQHLPILVRPTRRDTRPQVEQRSAGSGANRAHTHSLTHSLWRAQVCVLHMPKGR